MKVLIVHNAYQSQLIGGEDIVVKLEVEGLKEELGANNVFEYFISNDSIQPLKLAFTLWGNLKHYRAIQRLIAKQHINLVHIHNFFPLLTPLVFKAASFSGAKVVHTLHNFRWWCLSGIFYRANSGACEQCLGKRFMWSAIRYRCYRNSFLQSLVGSLAFYWYRLRNYSQYIDKYFALTRFQQSKLNQLLPSNKIVLKPNPVKLAALKVSAKDKKNYLFVGRLEAAKGIEMLLATWQKLPPHFHLDVIGNGPEAGDLIARYQANNIQFLGKLPHNEVLNRMAQAKYLLQCSLTYETFGLTIVEAFAAGTPVIGLNLATRAELIEHKENGFLYEAAGLKHTLLEAEDFPHYEKLVHNAYQTAKAFALPEVIAQQVKIYRALLDE